MSSAESTPAIGSPGRPLTRQALQKQTAAKKALGEDLNTAEQPSQYSNPAAGEPLSGVQDPSVILQSELQPPVPVTPVPSETDRIKDLERQVAVLQTSLFMASGERLQSVSHSGIGTSSQHHVNQPSESVRQQSSSFSGMQTANPEQLHLPVLDDQRSVMRPSNPYVPLVPSSVADQSQGVRSLFLPGNGMSYQGRNAGIEAAQPFRPESGSRLSVASGPKFGAPRVRVPEYTGSSEWAAFWMQFSMVARSCDWDEATQLQQLLLALKGEALEYVAQLPQLVSQSLSSLKPTLEKRYGDYVLPETHRASLLNLRKQPKESLREYGARVRRLMSKAYPGMEGSTMYAAMEVEYLVTGLPDPNMAFDILVKKPRSVEETMNMIEWYDCCKSTQKRRSGVRAVHEDANRHDSDQSAVEIRKIGNKRFVTEERLHQFGVSLQKNMTSALKDALSPYFTEKSTSSGDKPSEENPEELGLPVPVQKESTFLCYSCRQPGHMARDCPNGRREKIRELTEDVSTGDNLCASWDSEN